MPALSGFATVVLFLFLGGQSPTQERAVTPKVVDLLPSTTTVGHLVENDPPMPASVDKSAKGGPAHAFAFTVEKPTRLFGRLDCDTCAPHLALTGPSLKGPKVVKDDFSALIDAKLIAGTYTLWVGTMPAEGGAYTLWVDTEEAPESQLKVFKGVTARHQNGKKTVSGSAVVRLGTETVTVTFAATGDVVLTTKLTGIVEVTSSTSSSSNPTAAILFGPAFGTSSHQRYITVRTNEDYVVLEMPVDSFQVLLAELQTATRVKK